MLDAGSANGVAQYAKAGYALEGRARQSLAGIQRERILAAVTHVAAQRGAANVTVAGIVERAGVSRRTFYEVFSDSEASLLAAFEGALARVGAGVLPTYEAHDSWREGTRAALCALLAFLDDEPEIARLLLVEWLAAGTVALERRRDVLRHVVGAVDEGREKARVAGGDSPMIAEGLVGGALSILHAHVCERGQTSLLSLANPLMSMIVLPYLGPAAARKELARSLPERKRYPAAFDGANRLNGLPMRITYRTMVVLSAIAASPGASNRQVAQAADIADQGQVSKLLQRLERLGLIVNERTGQERGMANRWQLAPVGADIERAMGRSRATGS